MNQKFWYFGLVNSGGGLRERFGPFETRNEAQQVRNRMTKLGGFGLIGPVHSSKERYPANVPTWMRTGGARSNPIERTRQRELMDRTVWTSPGGRVAVVFMGTMEIGSPRKGRPHYRNVDAYSIFQDGNQTQPWHQKREAVRVARELTEKKASR